MLSLHSQAHIRMFDEAREVNEIHQLGAVDGSPAWKECVGVFPTTGQKFRSECTPRGDWSQWTLGAAQVARGPKARAGKKKGLGKSPDAKKLNMKTLKGKI